MGEPRDLPRTRRNRFVHPRSCPTSEITFASRPLQADFTCPVSLKGHPGQQAGRQQVEFACIRCQKDLTTKDERKRLLAVANNVSMPATNSSIRDVRFDQSRKFQRHGRRGMVKPSEPWPRNLFSPCTRLFVSTVEFRRNSLPTLAALRV